ncbi:MAG: PDGLE domain-containing protein [Deltaproteobacteria bacterium]|nr:PDGLE domain-containing protein [Deltaproteobacteria bacterium]
MDRKTWGFMLAGLALAVALAFVVAPFASSNPDGLDRVSQDHGFAEAAEGAQVWRRAPIPEYSFPRMDGPPPQGVAGVIGPSRSPASPTSARGSTARAVLPYQQTALERRIAEIGTAHRRAHGYYEMANRLIVGSADHEPIPIRLPRPPATSTWAATLASVALASAALASPDRPGHPAAPATAANPVVDGPPPRARPPSPKPRSSR